MESMAGRALYAGVREWMYRNARHIELCLWRYLFEGGAKEAVVEALAHYQNADGGFGHALEADNWNPDSTPIATNQALTILRKVGFVEMAHPLYRGIWKYLTSEKDLLSYGWRFTVPGNDAFPRAPWWNYSEEANRGEYYGVTAELAAFVLKYGDEGSVLYRKCEGLAKALLARLEAAEGFGDMGLEGYVVLLDVWELLGFSQEAARLRGELARRINRAIERDPKQWAHYGVRPSNFIRDPQSPFYAGNEEIVEAELQYLFDTAPRDGVWGITWTWFDNMAAYEPFFRVSENWWKGVKAIENMEFLRAFGRV